MTSGQFHSVQVSTIKVDRENRQRRKLDKIDILADSLSRVGLINPITITRELDLVAGERRLAAVRSLGWTHVACQYVDELDSFELKLIELEENVKRVDLTWQDQCLALLEYHTMRAERDKNWTQDDTAKAMGFNQQYVGEQINAATEMLKGRKDIIEADKLSTAKGILQRESSRRAQAAIEDLMAPEGQPEIEVGNAEILTANFFEWAQTYDGPRFNFIHCDFPYGIGADKFNQGSASTHGGYHDTPETYYELLGCMLVNLDRFCADSAHIVFWFSMEHYTETLKSLRSRFEVSAFPLIWYKSDNSGILPDPNRGPRRIYETAFFGHRGDRQVVRPVSNLCPTASDKSDHMSIKPEDMLHYFFGMVVDNTTLLLDPTCGSGSSIRAAVRREARYSLGLEINPEFADRARLALRKARRENGGSA